MDTPEALPVIGSVEREFGVAGHDASHIRIRSAVGDEPGADWVFQDIVRSRGESVAFAFFGAEHVIVGLVLPPGRRECGGGVFSEEGSGEALVGVGGATEPEQMDVVGHEHVRRADEPVTGAGMEQREPPVLMEGLGQPARGAAVDGVGPEDGSERLIMRRRKSGEVTARSRERGASGGIEIGGNRMGRRGS